MRIFLLVAVLVGLPVQAEAQATFLSGNDLVTYMREWDKYHAGQSSYNRATVGTVQGYIAASSDAYSAVGVICSPENVTVDQAAAVVASYLKSHPTEWHFAAVGLVRDALKEAFPCG